jgi:hypothetical protein
MTGREIVKRAIRFENPPRLPYSFPEKYGSDFEGVGMSPSVDARPKSGADEWGAVWHNIGISNLGEVKEYPLKDWADFEELNIPDINQPSRWKDLKGARQRAGDKFLLAGGVSLYERVHFLRGLENTWIDIYESPQELGRLIDLLVEMNLVAIERYAEAGCDGYIFCDDWGLQDRLMISPEKWREIWKPRYARVYKAARKAGLLTFLHSCGHIVDILDDLIEAGLDVIQMDQQMNMGLELLSERFGGRITFWCPVDIQAVMPHASLEEIRAYCRKMVKYLGRPEGGFMVKWYGDPAAAGHSDEAIDAMCEEFLAIGNGSVQN